MSIPSDNYDYDFLNRLSECFEHLYTNQTPDSTDITVQQFFFRSLQSAIKSGMLPGEATEKLFSDLQPLAEKKIQQLTPDELLRIKSLLKSQQQDTDSGISPPPPSPEPVLATASKTTSWVELFFSTPSPF